VDSPQGVDHALGLDSSQGVREEDRVEGGRWLLEIDRARDLEADAIGESGRETLAGLLNQFLRGVDTQHRRGPGRVLEGQAPVSAADFEHAGALKPAEAVEGGELRSGQDRVAGHERILS